MDHLFQLRILSLCEVACLDAGRFTMDIGELKHSLRWILRLNYLIVLVVRMLLAAYHLIINFVNIAAAGLDHICSFIKFILVVAVREAITFRSGGWSEPCQVVQILIYNEWLVVDMFGFCTGGDRCDLAPRVQVRAIYIRNVALQRVNLLRLDLSPGNIVRG